MIDLDPIERVLVDSGVVFAIDSSLAVSHQPGYIGWSFYSDGYRWILGREWADGPAMCFVMLNPSTGSGLKDDPTLRVCRGFAEREGMSGFVVVNLFAYRTPDPKLLIAAKNAGKDIAGPANDAVMLAALEAATVNVAAWGRNAARFEFRDRAQSAYSLLREHGGYFTLGLNRDGTPRHPCRLPAYTRLEGMVST